MRCLAALKQGGLDLSISTVERHISIMTAEYADTVRTGVLPTGNRLNWWHTVQDSLSKIHDAQSAADTNRKAKEAKAAKKAERAESNRTVRNEVHEQIALLGGADAAAAAVGIPAEQIDGYSETKLSAEKQVGRCPVLFCSHLSTGHKTCTQVNIIFCA